MAAQQGRYSVSEERASGAGSPQVIVIRDNAAGVEAAVAPSEGGELSSLRVKFRGAWVELLYRARDYGSAPGFRGKASFLWPAVGGQYPVGTTPESACSPGTYLVGGRSYPMPCHGFAKTLAWQETGHSADERGARVSVELRDSEQTRASYPFGFRVQATYELSGGRLAITYQVFSAAGDSVPMPFSIGNHIAFRVPFLQGTDAAAMLFETPSTVELLRDSHGLVSGEQRPRSFATATRLGDFNATVALPMAGYAGTPYALLADPQGVALRITHRASSALPQPLVQFNVYGGPGLGYFCPEPFFGLQNSLNLKKGLVTIEPGAEWRWTVELSPEIAGVEKVAGGFGFVEGPAWSRQGYVLFSDIPNGRIFKIGSQGPAVVYRDHSNAANGNALDVKGRLYTCERDGRRVARMETDGKITVVADRWQGKKLNSPNDVVVRRDGHVYFTDPASTAVKEPQELGFNGVYHVTPAGELSLVTRSMRRPNGVTVSPDGKLLYVADSDLKTVVAFDLDAQGNASGERVLISGIEGTPDGLRVAESGNLYVACRGIAIYTPEGKFLRMIEFPETPVNCTFADPDLRTLYVTARTSLYRVRISEPGSLQY